MEKEKIYSYIQLGYKVQKPKIKVGTRIKSVFNTKDGIKISKGKVISNNTIDFVTLTACYDIDTEDLDFLGRKIIIRGIPESVFVGY